MSSQKSSSQEPQNRPNDRDGDDVEDMATEYDFSHGVRGKHAMRMSAGFRMVIHHSDGTTEVREVTPRPGTVMLDPDVRAYFPDSAAVNRALRSLIGQSTQTHTQRDTTK